MITKAPEKFLTASETAEILNLKPKTIRAWIGQGRLGCVRFGRAVRVPMSEVSRLIELGSVPAVQQ